MTPFDPAGYAPDPSPNHIHSVVTKAPPLGRADLLASFAGLRVAWKTYFSGGSPVHADAPDAIRLHCYQNVHATHVAIDIFMNTNLAQYPELRTAQRYQGVMLYGRIESVINDFTINLQLDHLELKPHHFWDSAINW